MIYSYPELDEEELQVIDEIREIWRSLSHLGQSPVRWQGHLRRTAAARAVRGSNSIEGIHVSMDDAVAAVERDTPLAASGKAWEATVAYQEAMTYVIYQADDPNFRYSVDRICSLHYLMMKYDPAVLPGRMRPGTVHVVRQPAGEIVYDGAPVEDVPALMNELAESLNDRDRSIPSPVHAAMAHLNLVMIHPFKDGNGRMARCLQTLVLARGGTLYPPFASIEEYLGRNTQSYYSVLESVGGRRWDPGRDARPWLRFCLVAHHRQANTVLRRSRVASDVWERLADIVGDHGMPERMIMALLDAASGLTVRNSTYRSAALIASNLASRDLKRLSDVGLLDAHGDKRGRYYTASPDLLSLKKTIDERHHRPLADPFDNVRSASAPGMD